MSEGKIVFPLNSGVRSPSFIASADVHLNKKLYNTPELAEDLKDNLTRLVDLAIEKKVQYLVIAGDLFENNTHVRPNNMAHIASLIEKLKANGSRLIGIAGDHDKPILGESWLRVSGIEPVTIEPAFAGIDYFDYSTTTVEELIKVIKAGRDCNKVLWLFLHCQFPQLFERAEPKKLIDYNQLKLFENFPNIQGIIAGDIHFAPEGRAFGVGHEAYVGYPGSLGINDRSEYKHEKHVLWCDGKHLMQLPFPLLRPWREIDFRGKLADDFDLSVHLDWAKAQSMKPIIYVDYDIESENQIQKIAQLYDHALVKITQKALGSDLDEEQGMACRSETAADDKVAKALRYYTVNDEELFKLASDLLKDDAKVILDKFKNNFKL